MVLLRLVVISCLLVVTTVSAAAGRRPRRWNRPTSDLSTTSADGCPVLPPCWKNCGSAGYMKDSHGCTLCACKSPSNCPSIECPGPRGLCPHGHARDEHGCSLCECAVPANCSQIMCRMHCEHGFVKSADGCPLCQCHTPPAGPAQLPAAAAASSGAECSEVTCLMSCEHGRVLDEDGCETCECRPSPIQTDCQARKCRNHCVFGRHVNKHGCETCACVRRPAATRPVVPRPAIAVANESLRHCGAICQMYCPFGFQTGDDGCPVCTCNEQPADDRPRTTRRQWRRQRRQQRRSRCSVLVATCAMFCPQGFQRDNRGCAVCACQDTTTAGNVTKPEAGSSSADVTSQITVSCRRRRCHRYTRCAFGFRMNHIGCPTCACKFRAEAMAGGSTDAGQCTPLRRCRRICPGGFAVDENGCEICECRLGNDDASNHDDDEMQSDQPQPQHQIHADIISNGRRKVCIMPPEVGPCRAAIPRWHFDPRDNQCFQFIYGGCRGNVNNFPSKSDCELFCDVPMA